MPRQVVDLPERIDGGSLLSFSVRLPWDELDEAEVYLSLDGGRSFPIRLSEEVHARHAVTFDVSLPNFVAKSAQLKVHAGGRTADGHVEVEVARSARFEIVPNRRAAATRPWADRGIRRRLGNHSHVEWWFTTTAWQPLDLSEDALHGAGRVKVGTGRSESALVTDAVPHSRRPKAASRASLRGEAGEPDLGPPAPLEQIRFQLVAGPRPMRD